MLTLAGGGVAEVLDGRARLPRVPSFVTNPAGRLRAFRTRPDLQPPTVKTTVGPAADGVGGGDPGFLFLGPGPVSLTGSQQYGPLIADRRGGLVWFRPLIGRLQATNFAPSEYRGKPVLVWWQGEVFKSGYGRGEAVLVDRTYREVARVRAARGRSMDLHALSLTPEGTALFTCHPETVPADLSSIGGPRETQVFEPIIQEVDVASGRLLFEWRSLEHIPVDDSYLPLGEPYDYLHPNSIQRLPDGNLLVSARHTWALYKLERRTGKIIWTLGGKRSDFRMGPGTRFAWQHDARRLSQRLLTVFDNGSDGPIKTERESRGLVLHIDESHRRVNLGNAYTSPQRLLAGAMGSVQVLSSGRVVVGWGVMSHISEFSADGALLLDVALPAGLYSYRGLWLPWQGLPHNRPAVAAARSRTTGTALLYASWNGATEVTSWQVDAGSTHDHVRPLGIATHRGFETVIPLDRRVRLASVTALDRFGRPLRRSHIVEL